MHRIPGSRAQRFAWIVRTLWPVWIGFVLMIPPALHAQTPPTPSPQQSPPDTARDLKPVHPGDNAKPIVPGAVPQSYALVVGISNYENLPATAQLHYPGRDAQSIYTTLISEQGGEFPEATSTCSRTRRPLWPTCCMKWIRGCPR